MFYYLSELHDVFSALRVFQYTTFRAVMAALMLMLYAFAWTVRPARYTFVFLVMLVFVCFNPVLYVQYILWAIPLGLLVLCDVRDALGQPAASGRREAAVGSGE